MGACQTYCSASTSGGSLTADDIARAFYEVARYGAAADIPTLANITKDDVYEQTELYCDETICVVEYAPKLFAAIRHAIGVRAATFADEWLEQGETYQESGRSLATFLRSRSKRYLAKTVSSTEVDTILELALDLLKYWTEWPTSLMMRLLGLVRIERLDNRDVGYVICATDILVRADTLHELFDLKGRVPKPPKPDDNVAETYRVMKDKHLAAPFVLPSREARDELVSRLRRDVDFLCSHRLMDYSVLVGVKRRETMAPSRRCSVVPQTVERQFAVDPEEMSAVHVVQGENDVEEYHVGVIDLFTSYNSKKRVAHAMKSTLWKSKMLSTIPPEEYAARLMRFCEQRFVSHPTSPFAE